LSWANLSAFSKIAIAWGLLAAALQAAIFYFDIQYDSKLSLLWWMNSVIIFPSHMVIEFLDLLGFRMRGFLGYLFITVLLCFILVFSFEISKSPKPV
jgi:hypothetical protein